MRQSSFFCPGKARRGEERHVALPPPPPPPPPPPQVSTPPPGGAPTGGGKKGGSLTGKAFASKNKETGRMRTGNLYLHRVKRPVGVWTVKCHLAKCAVIC